MLSNNFGYVIFFGTLLVALFIVTNYSHDLQSQLSTWIVVENVQNLTIKNDSVLIVAWTPFFSYKLDGKWNSDIPYCSSRTPQCEITSDRSQLSHADGVIFHQRNDWSPLPTYRYSNQKYIWYVMESPNHTGNMKSLKSTKRKYFNLTMTYRQDSDVVHSYVRFVKRKTQNKMWKQEVEDNLVNKTKSIGWLVSNCQTSSRREVYVRKLQELIEVDVYGACGPLSCARGGGENGCDYILRNNYWFYLSFENSICPDYITEKFTRALHSFAIPIVLKGSIYRNLAPPQSYIAADSFSSTVHLVEHLQYLLRNRTAYFEYFEWRRDYEIGDWSTAWCELCEKIWETRGETSVRENICEWYQGRNNDICDRAFAEKLP